jgi:mRNA interferase HicA
MKSSELLKKILKAGWYEVRQTGSHKILMHDKYEHTIVFPYHGSKEVGKGIENALLKQAGLK